MIKFVLLSLGILLWMSPTYSQYVTETIADEISEDFNLGGDIFSDFNEDIEATQILEDERFYRYGRFFSVNLGIGLTTFDGNRGRAYDNEPPSYHFSITYFFNFRVAFNLGLAYSKHHMIIDTQTLGFGATVPGLIEVNMFRTFMGFRYYVDTTDLGTAITYSNPYFALRMEYWYQTNKFVDQEQLGSESGGGFGAAIGGGLEFPMEIKVSYIGLEFMYHVVNFFDKFTQNYRQDSSNSESTYGYDDLSGNVWTTVVSYNLSW